MARVTDLETLPRITAPSPPKVRLHGPRPRIWTFRRALITDGLTIARAAID
jgi:hypothetical protein